MGDIEDYPFRFMNTPESLRIVASAEVALMLWRRERATSRPSLKYSELCSGKKLNCEKILDIQVPRPVQAQIDEKITSICDDLRCWSEFFDDDGCFETTVSKCLNHMVVNCFGDICFKATALNVLNFGELGNAEKYRLACVCCFEEQIRKLWPFVAEDEQIGHTLIFYWNRRMKSMESVIEDHLSVKGRLENTRNKSNWPAFEYFWKTLVNDGEKVSQAIWFVRYSNEKALKRILPKLNRLLAEKVVEAVAPQILQILFSNEKYYQDVYRLWARFGRIVYEKESAFCDVLLKLWEMVFNPCYDTRFHLNNTQCGKINDFLLEIWSKASEDLKDRVSKLRVYDFFVWLSSSEIRFDCHYGHDMAFALDVLKRSQIANKEQIWETYWRKLYLRAKPSYLEEFMKLCLPINHPDFDIWLYKLRLMREKKLFRLLIEAGFYSDLKCYLNFFSSNSSGFQELGKEMLESNVDAILLHDYDKFVEFDWFVGELFSNVRKDVAEFKAQLISSAENMQFLFKRRYADGIRSNDFISVIDRFVGDDEEKLITVKRKLFEHFRTLVHCGWKVDQWQRFLEWCTVDREQLSAFKSSLNIDEIFLAHLKLYFNGEGDAVFGFLDSFLEWYFISKEDVENFKFDKMKNYQRIDYFSVKLDSNADCDRSLMYKLLRWFLL